MSAYVISQVAVRDPEALQQYRSRAAKTFAKYGGRYRVRAGAAKEVLEGDWPQMVVVVEFPDMERARAWYSSPEYAEALVFRDKALTRNLIIVDGVSDEG